jgi:hypothetical protein
MSGAGDEQEREVVQYARHRYLNDAEFHAKVDVAVMIAHQHAEGDLTALAAIALAMEWVDPMTGAIRDT